jgi:lysophospholipase L1-like esterase
VTLNWTAAARAASYTVKRSLANGGPYTEIASNITATTYTNTGLTNGTTYYYVVSAGNIIGDSPDSSQASATPQVPPAAPVRIMCVGDSITAGYTDNPSWNVPFQFGYRSGLYTRLSAAGYPFQFVGASAEPWNGVFGTPTNTPSPDLRTVDQDHHRGYGGWGTAGILSNIAGWLTTDNPDVVLLMIGINDGGSVEARANLNSIVQTMVTNKPNARVIVAQITPTASFSQTLVDYNTYIRDTLVPSYQAQGKYVTTVNQYANLLTNGSIDPSLFSNGINHPNAVAYDRMAQTWFAGIQAAEYLKWCGNYPGVILTNPAADADGDGLTNKQEFAFGLDPTKGSPVNPITHTSALKSGQFSYSRWATSGLTYSVWTSTDLRNWAKDATATQTPGAAVDGVRTVAVTLTAPLPGGKVFVRVQAQ